MNANARGDWAGIPRMAEIDARLRGESFAALVQQTPSLGASLILEYLNQNRQLKRGAAVLLRKRESGIFDEAIQRAEHLPHDGDEADLSGFTAGLEPLIERCEDRIVARGGHSGHI